MKVIKLTTTTQQSEVEHESGIFQGIANSLDFTRSGIRVSEEAGESVVGKKVPLLLSHDWGQPSIGSVTMTAVDKEGLHYEAKLYNSAPNRDLLLEGIENGTNFVSIGFGADNIDNQGNIDSIDLIEMSLTSTPADPKATAELVKQAIEDKKEDDNMADNNTDPKATPVDPKTDQKDEPTLADVLKAVQDLSALVTKALDPESEKKPADDKAPDDKEAEVQALKQANAELLSIAHKVPRNDLTVKQSMFLAHQGVAK